MPARRLRFRPSAQRPLPDLLLEAGVEFPCGGAGTCGDCRVRVLRGKVPVTAPMREWLSPEELGEGWRLGCCSSSSGEVEFEVERWTVAILGDEMPLRLEPRPGFGVVADVGTTTLVLQCVDLETGEIVGTQSALNPQTCSGADVMTRIHHDLRHPGHLRNVIREELGRMLLAASGGRSITEVLLAGNTVMHHLFCDLSVGSLAAVPFRTDSTGQRVFLASELGWEVAGDPPVTFLPCIGGFVGSDLLAGLIACGLGHGDEPRALMDLGTNGEIALWDGQRIRCASTAAGPAFEGGGISRGMRAGSGAIHRVERADGHLHLHVIGGGTPKGICGSGLLDAIACALDLGALHASGRLVNGGRTFPLGAGMVLTQRDIRELQLAKGAVAAGIGLLIEEAGGAVPARIHLAGAFGNYIHEASARRTGLLPNSGVAVEAAGNSALRGVRLLLLTPSEREAAIDGTLRRTRHVELAALPAFQDAFVDALAFPE